MAINALQPILRGATGKELQFTGDFHAYWDQLGIPPGQFAERMAAWKALPQNAAWIDATEDADAAVVVEGLWRNGEQGAWYDPSDLSTMFQDASGTTPVYMPGQGQPDCWIGLQLDKRFGLALGPELCANGAFTVDVSGWTRDIAWAPPGIARVATSAISGPYQQLSTIPGKRYRVSARVITSSVTARVRVCTDTSLVTTVAETADISAGRLEMSFLATSPSSTIYLRNAAAGITDWDDISIRELPGNHRWQGTATSRSVLSARYNLLVRTEDFSATAWANLAGGAGGVPVKTPGYATAPNGTMTATRVQLALNAGASIGDISGISQGGVPVAIGANYSGKVWLKASTPADVGKIVLLRHAGGTTYQPCALPAEWAAFGRDEPAGASTATFFIGLRGASGGASDSVDMLVWGADLRAVGDGVGLPPYQRVIDANTYDTVGFPLYRKPDGVDDWMQTASVDFTGTSDIFVSVAARKISDATLQANLVELSNSSTANTGTFWLAAPWAVSSGAGFRSRGTSIASAFSNLSPTANETAVLTGVGSISKGVCQLWKNGVLIASDTAAQGAGNLGNYPLYFDRRGGTTLTSGARDYGTLIVGRLLTAPEIAAVEKLLRSKSRAY